MSNFNHEDVQKAIRVAKDAIDDLVIELIETAMQQAIQIDRLIKLSLESINLLRIYSIDANKDLLHHQIRQFYDLNDHIIEVNSILISSVESTNSERTFYRVRSFANKMIFIRFVNYYIISRLRKVTKFTPSLRNIIFECLDHK